MYKDVFPSYKKSFSCPLEECQKVYSRQDSLKHHLQHDHLMEDVVKKGRFLCSHCEKKYYHATRLVKHCEKEHDLQIGKTIYCVSSPMT